MTLNPLLTPREKEILLSLTEGKTNRQIASELNVSESTVKSHLSSIYSKLDVSNRTQAGLAGLRIFSILQVLAS
jgi:DNA-binding NarL/FixJ family response regulator